MSRFLSCISSCPSGVPSIDDKDRSGLEVVLRKYQLEKNIFIRAVWEENNIHLCNKQGAVLKSIPLSTTEWSSCTLPGYRECICLRYKEQEKSELLLQGRSRDVVDRVLLELTQSKALGTTMGAIREEKDDVDRLQTIISALRGQIQQEKDKAEGFERKCNKLQRALDQHASRRGCTPEQMKTCLARIEELESRNGRLDEDLRIQVRRTKAISNQLEMVKVELERSEEEKSALVESLTQCHVQMSDMKKLSPQDHKVSLHSEFSF